MIKRESIENLKQQVDLYQVVSDYVTLSRAGNSWKGLSPFSQEKTPSFYVYPEKGFFYCFSTSQGGDAIRFIQLKENLTFVESVEHIAERFNVRLEYESSTGAKRPAGGSRDLLKLHEIASRYFAQELTKDNPESRQALEYWESGRGFSRELAKEHQIGYAPAEGKGLFPLLKSEGFSDKMIEESGLFFSRGNSETFRPFARFRGRLMIPIREINGKVIAFTARKMPTTPKDDPAHEAKYVNSPGTLIFHKSNVLFGLHHARQYVGKGLPFVMVEGQLDAMRCWSVGIDQAVAPQGTAVTENQLAKLKNYHPSMICFLDGDSAGFKAASRIVAMSLSVGLEVHFILLPEGDDPDLFLKDKGKEGFEELKKDAVDVVQFLVKSSFAEASNPEQKARALEECFEAINQSPSQVIVGGLLERLASLTNIDLSAIREDYQRWSRRKTRPNDLNTASSEMPVLNSKLTTSESDLLHLILHYPELRRQEALFEIDSLVNEDDLNGRLLNRIAIELMENPEWDPNQDNGMVAETDEEINYLYKVLAREPNYDDKDQSFRLCIARLQHRRDKRQLRSLERKINQMQPDAIDQQLALLNEKKELQIKIAKRVELHSLT